jgi:hypothetical protein
LIHGNNPPALIHKSWLQLVCGSTLATKCV